jgi:hypothetical protein
MSLMPPRVGTNRIEPPFGGVTITPHDSNTQGTIATDPIHAFMVNAAGDVAVVMADGSAVTYFDCVLGTIYPGFITRIKATGTTATSVTGFRPSKGQ